MQVVCPEDATSTELLYKEDGQALQDVFALLHRRPTRQWPFTLVLVLDRNHSNFCELLARHHLAAI